MTLSEKKITEVLGKRVMAYTQHVGSGHVQARGKVIAVANHPTYVIELEDGTHINWAAHLCRVLDGAENCLSCVHSDAILDDGDDGTGYVKCPVLGWLHIDDFHIIKCEGYKKKENEE